ncbi:hypothetical protein CKO28_18545 [Rhodovibrio sodomensis]|uniref:TrwC relaxase domain-containing protein n=1 Tax=Rhodovibrio sodomensis TaxID=1088 RepID=A0ABS1DIW5_9PROT|nr:MobF family relaxase [Rhodovibrio sodomensis]MBK1670037.1 hypothetical protein [Rhodovibrio sodomensis]
MLETTKKSGGAGAIKYYLERHEQESVGGWYERDRNGHPVGMLRDPGGVLAGMGAADAKGRADREALRHLARGYLPDGTRVAHNADSPTRVIGTDFTYSAPKGLSLTLAEAERAGDKKLANAIKSALIGAVDDAQAFMDGKTAFARFGSGDPVPASAVGAAFIHYDNRAGEPNAHVHFYQWSHGRTPDGRFGTIDPDAPRRWKHAGGSAFRASLAARLREIGIPVRTFADRHGNTLMDVAGVPEEVKKAFSSRRAALEKARAKAERSGPLRNPRAFSIAVAKGTKQAKGAAANRANRIEGLRGLVSNAYTPGDVPEVPHDAVGLADDLASRLFDGETVWTEKVAYTRAMEFATERGMGVQAAIAAAEKVMSDPMTIPLGRGRHKELEFAFESRLEAERDVAIEALSSRGAFAPASSRQTSDAARRAISERADISNPKQNDVLPAVRRALSGDGVSCLDAKGPDAELLASAIRHADPTAVVVEGADRLPTGEIEELVQGRDPDARLIFIGERREVDPSRPGSGKDVGGGFRLLADRLGTEGIRRDEPRRLISEGAWEKAIDALDKSGRLTVDQSGDAESGVAATAASRSEGSVAVCATMAEAKRVSEAIRNTLKSMGAVGDDEAIMPRPKGGDLAVARGDTVALPDGTLGTVERLETDAEPHPRKKGVDSPLPRATGVWVLPSGSEPGEEIHVSPKLKDKDKTLPLRRGYAFTPGSMGPVKPSRAVVLGSGRLTGEGLRGTFKAAGTVKVLLDPSGLGDASPKSAFASKLGEGPGGCGLDRNAGALAVNGTKSDLELAVAGKRSRGFAIEVNR